VVVASKDYHGIIFWDLKREFNLYFLTQNLCRIILSNLVLMKKNLMRFSTRKL